MPRVAVLSIGWAAFFHPDSDPALTSIVSQSTVFGPLTFNCIFFGAQLTHSFNNPIDLGSAYQLTAKLLPTVFSCLNLHFLTKTSSFFFSPKLLFLDKPLSFDYLFIYG
jgi:hypothetical protein